MKNKYLVTVITVGEGKSAPVYMLAAWGGGWRGQSASRPMISGVEVKKIVFCGPLSRTRNILK